MGRFSDTLRLFLRGAWRELPWETTAIMISATCLAALAQNWSGSTWLLGSETWLWRGFFAGVLLTPVFFSLNLARRQGNISARFLSVVSGCIAVAVIGATILLLPDGRDPGHPKFTWWFGPFVIGCLFTPFGTIALTSPTRVRFARFSAFVRAFCETTIVWALYWSASMVALVTLSWAVGELFRFRDAGRVGFQLGCFVTASLLLVYLHRFLHVLSGTTRDRVSIVWRQLIAWVGAPFVSAMLGILMAYEIWVVVRQQMPQNVLSPLIIAAGSVGFLCSLVIQSVSLESSHSAVLRSGVWFRRFSIRVVRAFPAVLFALLPMAGWALFVRIDQYGFTQLRVSRMMALLCLGLLAGLGTIRWVRKQAPLSWQVPVAACVCALITAWGPLSANAISERSQVRRLQRLLDRTSIVTRNVQEEPSKTYRQISDEQFSQLEAQIEAVAKVSGKGGIAQVFTGNISVCNSRWSGATCLHHLGIGADAGPSRRQEYLFRNEQDPVRVGDWVLHRVDLERTDGYTADGLVLLGDRIGRIRGGNIVSTVPVAQTFLCQAKTHSLPNSSLVIPEEPGRLSSELIVSNVVRYFDASGQCVVDRIYGLWLEPKG